MILLAIDTSTERASLALCVGEKIFERDECVTTYSERLLIIIDELLQEAGVDIHAVRGIVCGGGPGSFTGLRMGLSTAKGLCLGTGAPLFVVSSLAALAAQALGNSRVLASINGFRGEVYAGYFDVDETGYPRARSEALSGFSCPLDAISVKLDGETPTHFIGTPNATPRARELLFLAKPRFLSGDIDDPRSAAPKYIRLSAPEEARR